MKNNFLFIIIAIIIIAIIVFAFYYLTSEQGGDMFFKPGTETGDDQSLSEVLKKGKIILGTYPEFAPMTFKDDEGKNIGYDIDLINEVVKRLGVTLEIKEMTFPDLFPAVKNKSIDIAISSITITPERSETVLFSIPYFTSGQSIIIREESEEIGPEDFKGKKIAAIRNTTCAAAAMDYLDEPYEELVTTETFPEEIDLLKKGEVDVVVHDYCVAAYEVKDDPAIKIVGDPFTQEYYGIMSNIENDTLVEKINEILREIKRDDKLKEYDEKWFGEEGN